MPKARPTKDPTLWERDGIHYATGVLPNGHRWEATGANPVAVLTLWRSMWTETMRQKYGSRPKKPKASKSKPQGWRQAMWPKRAEPMDMARILKVAAERQKEHA